MKMNKIEGFGQVYKAHSDSYTIKIGTEFFRCGARGVLKLKGNGISVGDFVSVSNGVITSVKDRKNHFIRPNVSNVDLVVAVFSIQPKPDFYLIDKLLINSTKEDVEFIIVVNKNDISGELFEKIKMEYSPLGVEVLSVSAKTGQGLIELKESLKGKLAVLAGQSAAGKTSIVNNLFGLDLKTGEISSKISRGKHTTTRSEIFECDGVKVIDSPGFAVLDADINIKDLPNYYLEYVNVANLCKYRGCTHTGEPECKVKELVDSGVLSKERYDRYLFIYNEISKRRIIYEKN